jgi:hypothetical protein
MQKLGQVIKNINNQRRKTMANTEIYEAIVKGVKDIHTEDAPVKYWLSVDLDNGSERRLYVEQNCKHIQKGQRVKVTGYPIKKAGSNNQTCVSIDSLDGSEAPIVTDAPVPVRSNVKAPSNNDWKEKYRLTMSNLISSWLASGKQLSDDEYDQIDKYVRKILDAQYVTDTMEEAPF